MISKKEAYEKTVKINSDKMVLNTEIKSLENSIEKAIFEGSYQVFFPIQVGSVAYQPIKKILEDKGYEVKRSLDSPGLSIHWSL